jgi:aryl-alcohol dehydrogenase-like predicted oxidoreductase
MSYGTSKRREWILDKEQSLYIGASSMYAWEFAKFLYVAETNGYAHGLYYQDSDFAIVDRVTQLAWMLHKPGITAPIIGATKPHHLDDLAKALQVKLASEEISALEEPYQPHAVSGF